MLASTVHISPKLLKKKKRKRNLVKYLSTLVFTLADSEILSHNTVNSSTYDLLLVWGILKPHHVYSQIMTTVSSAVTHSSFSFISVLACLETYLNSHSPHPFYLVVYSGQIYTQLLQRFSPALPTWTSAHLHVTQHIVPIFPRLAENGKILAKPKN